jgi:hypothetical protein
MHINRFQNSVCYIHKKTFIKYLGSAYMLEILTDSFWVNIYVVSSL